MAVTDLLPPAARTGSPATSTPPAPQPLQGGVQVVGLHPEVVEAVVRPVVRFGSRLARLGAAHVQQHTPYHDPDPLGRLVAELAGDAAVENGGPPPRGRPRVRRP